MTEDVRRRLIALGLALAGFAVLATSSASMGVTWDEAIYMRSARRYVNWFTVLRQSPAEAFSRQTIDEYWSVAVVQQGSAAASRQGVEDIHPPLLKLAGGLSWRALRGVTGDLLAYRLPVALLFGLLLATLYLWVSEALGQTAGLTAALSLAVMPRFFAQAGLLALDAPLSALTLLAAYLYWKATARRSLRWALPFGVVWGLALATKNGGWLLALPLLAWALLVRRQALDLLRLALGGLVAVAVFVLAWPWLYHDTLARLAGFAGFAFLGHADLLQQYTYYLGHIYQRPPWHYPLLMTAAVLPSTVLAAALAGLVLVVGRWGDTAVEKKQRDAGGLLALGALGPMLPFLLGLVSAYDAERLFLPAFPFIAALAGVGFDRICRLVWGALWQRLPRLMARRSGERFRSAVAGALAMLLLWPGVAGILRLQPYALSYYSELVGGMRGAAALGFETTYWADGYQGVLDYVNRTAAEKATIWADAYQVLWAYQDLGRLRKDLFVPGSDPRDPLVGELAIVQARQSRYTSAVAELLATQPPAYTLSVDGVPLVHVYRTH